MNKVLLATIFTLFFTNTLGAKSPEENLLSEIQTALSRFYEQQNFVGAEGRLFENLMVKQRVTKISGGNQKSTDVFLLTKDLQTILVFLNDERGIPTVFLQRGYNTWIFREGLRLPLKVTLSQNVYGDINLGDILGVNLVENFECSDASVMNGTIKAIFRKLRSHYPYPFVEVEINRETLDLLRIQYNGLSGDGIHEAVLHSYANIDSKHRFPVWMIRNLHINMEQYTELHYLSVQPKTIPDSFFQPNASALSQFLIWARNLK